MAMFLTEGVTPWGESGILMSGDAWFAAGQWKERSAIVLLHRPAVGRGG